LVKRAGAEVESLRPVRRRPLATEVYDQLLARILHGEIAVGTALPSERNLALQFGVNRNVVREGLKRLEHSGLIEIRHGGATRVLNFRRNGGVELLFPLLMTSAVDGRTVGVTDARVGPAVLELRGSLAETAARLAAERRKSKHVDVLRTHVRYMYEAGLRAEVLERIGSDLWREIAAATDNLAIELTWSTLNRAVSQLADTPHLLTIDPRVIADHDALVDAIIRREPKGAAEIAQRLASSPAQPSGSKRRLTSTSKKTTR